MSIKPAVFWIDPTPRRADGEYIAHVRICFCNADPHESDDYFSGDLAGFDQRSDAVAFARAWAEKWILQSRIQEK
jgi:hypothetical protein